jgi:FixJ family two-component response regulator
MDGMALVVQLRRARPDIAVMYMSGYSNILATRGFTDREAVLLEKPFTASVLLSAVRKLLDKASANGARAASP